MNLPTRQPIIHSIYPSGLILAVVLAAGPDWASPGRPLHPVDSTTTRT